jgi:hypothetical protein
MFFKKREHIRTSVRRSGCCVNVAPSICRIGGQNWVESSRWSHDFGRPPFAHLKSVTFCPDLFPHLYQCNLHTEISSRVLRRAVSWKSARAKCAKCTARVHCLLRPCTLRSFCDPLGTVAETFFVSLFQCSAESPSVTFSRYFQTYLLIIFNAFPIFCSSLHLCLVQAESHSKIARYDWIVSTRLELYDKRCRQTCDDMWFTRTLF